MSDPDNEAPVQEQRSEAGDAGINFDDSQADGDFDLDAHMSEEDKREGGGELNDLLGVHDEGEEHNMLDINDDTEKAVGGEQSQVEWVQINNLTRPFTEGALRRKIESVGGKIADIKSDFWLNTIKSMACVRLENHTEIIEEFKTALNGKNWPNSNPKQLEVTVITGADKEKHVSRQNNSSREPRRRTPERGIREERKRRSPSPVPPLPERIDDKKLEEFGIFKTKTTPHLYWKMTAKRPKKVVTEEKPKEDEQVKVDGDVKSEVGSTKSEGQKSGSGGVPDEGVVANGECAEEAPTQEVEAQSPVPAEQAVAMEA